MEITKEIWNEFKKYLVPGCTFKYQIDTQEQKYAKAVILETNKAAFLNPAWEQAWDILSYAGNMQFHRLYDFNWPDGLPMEGWQRTPEPPTKEQRIINKCKDLDQRFKTKLLPKCKTVSLSFPDKKESSSSKKEKDAPMTEDAFYAYSHNSAYSSSPLYRRYVPPTINAVTSGTTMDFNTWLTTI